MRPSPTAPGCQVVGYHLRAGSVTETFPLKAVSRFHLRTFSAEDTNATVGTLGDPHHCPLRRVARASAFYPVSALTWLVLMDVGQGLTLRVAQDRNL